MQVVHEVCSYVVGPQIGDNLVGRDATNRLCVCRTATRP